MDPTKNDAAEALRDLRLAEECFMRRMGWRSIDADGMGDWVPPEDAQNFWDRDRALEECRARALKALTGGV